MQITHILDSLITAEKKTLKVLLIQYNIPSNCSSDEPNRVT